MKNRSLIIVFIFMILLCSGCNNTNKKETIEDIKFEENEDIKVLKEEMSIDEMKDFFLTSIQNIKFHYGEVTYQWRDGKPYDVKSSMYKAYVFFDQNDSSIYVMDNYWNDDYFESISEKELLNYSIDDIKSNEQLKYDYCSLENYEVVKVDDVLYLNVTGQTNDEYLPTCIFQIPESGKYVYAKVSLLFSENLYYDYDLARAETNKIYDNEKSKEAKKKPEIGMTASEVKSTLWGSPDKINTYESSYGIKEQWVYRTHGYVYFENGKVTSISER